MYGLLEKESVMETKEVVQNRGGVKLDQYSYLHRLDLTDIALKIVFLFFLFFNFLNPGQISSSLKKTFK